MNRESILFENHFNEKVIEIQFPKGYNINSPSDIATLKAAWTNNLKKWHSPYTCLFDLRQFTVAEPLQEDFKNTLSFFKKFFMRKLIGFTQGQNFPFDIGHPVCLSYEEAVGHTRLSKGAGLTQSLEGIRHSILVENDFQAHVMEVSMKRPVHLETPEDIATLKDKLRNMLRMWHSPYSIIFDCSDLSFSEAAAAEFQALEKFLKMFFCKKIIGYAPKQDKTQYPFPCFRSRHKAAAQLENEGMTSGEVANCSTRTLSAQNSEIKK